MKGFFGLLIVIILIFPILLVWTTFEKENLENKTVEKMLILIERKNAIEKDLKFIMSEAAKRSKTKEELKNNIIYAAKTLESEYLEDGIEIKFSGGWCGSKNVLFDLDEILDLIVEHNGKPAISHGSFEDMEWIRETGAGRKACIVADVKMKEINFTVSWLEGEI